MLYLRSGLGKAFIKAGKDTADIAAQKAYDLANSPGPRVNRPGIAAKCVCLLYSLFELPTDILVVSRSLQPNLNLQAVSDPRFL